MTISPIKEEHTFSFNIDTSTDYVYNPGLVAFGPDAAFSLTPSDVGFIQNNVPIELTYVDYITLDTNNQDLLRFQVSVDGHRWYYFNDVTLVWTPVLNVASPIITETSSASGFLENIHNFAWEVGDGALFIRTFLTDPSVEIREMYIKYKKHYAKIKEVKQSMERFSLIKMNTFTMLPENFVNYEMVKERMVDADAYIDNDTQMSFGYHENQLEWHDGNGTNMLVLRWFPILNLHYLVMYNQMLQAMRTFLDSEIIFGQGGEWGEVFLPPIYPAYLTDHPIKSLFGNVFITGNRNIEVSYDWGYIKTPNDIANASKKLMVIYLLNDFLAYLSKGGSSRSIDGYSESYAAKGPFMAVIDQYQKEVDKMLSKRRKIYGRFV